MPKCSFHPNVDTELSCTQCGRAICPKEMVDTPVGYKCPVCARQPRSAVVHVKGRQLWGGIGLGALAGVGGAFLLGLFGGGFFSIILGFLWGGITAEAVHRGSGGHRGGAVTAIAIGAIVIGTLIDWFLIGPMLGLRGVSALTALFGVIGAAGDSAAWWARR